MYRKTEIESASIPIPLSSHQVLSFQFQHLPQFPQLLPLCRATSLLLSALLSSGRPVLPDPSRSMALHPTCTDNKVHTYFLIVSKLLHHLNYLSFIFSHESHRTWWHSWSDPRMFHCRAMRSHIRRSTKQNTTNVWSPSKFSREKNALLHGLCRLWKKEIKTPSWIEPSPTKNEKTPFFKFKIFFF